MANFQTHVTTSTVLGIGYAGVGFYYGLPVESAIIAGGLCGIGGMLPDIDSDHGRPLRETMSFAAAVAPMMLLHRFQQLGFNYEQVVLVTGATYLFVRFALARVIARYTVHRGMFHSIPAMLIFAGLTFLVSQSNNLQLRYFKAGGVLLGVLSHLLLDEIYSVEWKLGRWRFKKSFGTALKMWGPSFLGNLSTYAKLALVAVLILSEPMVLDRYGQLSPIVVNRAMIREELNHRLGGDEGAWNADAVAVDAGGYPVTTSVTIEGEHPHSGPDQTIYDTARRIWRNILE
jgi:membrane-bound metal-dependent hydrolase YbcI (DUF457 family)